MKKCKWYVILMVAGGILIPQIVMAQGLAEQMKGLHGILDKIYDEMMPLCSKLIGVGRGIAGFAAIWYIASRVWKHIANAEAIDFYPLFRPFCLGFCIIFFPLLLDMVNFVMKPTVTGTAQMMEGSNKAIEQLLKQKEEALKKTDLWQMYVGENKEGDRDRWYKYTHEDADPSMEGPIASLGNDIRFGMAKYAYNFQNSVKAWMSEILKLLFEAAALCINTLRTFQLIVLAILGPIVFALAVFDGFQHTLAAWLAKYINIYLWLPVANIFGSIIGKIQEQMIKLDISQIDSAGDTFFSSTDAAYLVFMIIGIVGYFTVPSIANSIVNAGGGSAMVQKVTSMLSGAAGSPVSGMKSAIDTKKSFDDGRKYDAGTGFSGALGRLSGSGKGDGEYQHSKLKGRNE